MKKRLFFLFAAFSVVLSTTGIGLPQVSAATMQLNGTLQAQPSNAEFVGTLQAAPSAQDSNTLDKIALPPPGGDPPQAPGGISDVPNLTDCSDGLDNDEDGKEDNDDRGCNTNPYWGEYDPTDEDEVSCTDPNFPVWIYSSNPPYNGDWIFTGGSCNEHWESCNFKKEMGFELPKKCLQPPPDLDGPKCYDEQGDQIYCPDPQNPDGPGGLTNPTPQPDPHPHFTINVPVENQIMDKDDAYTVSGECTENYHVFISANNTKNPAYVKCSNDGTYKISGLKWLDSVKPGSSQLISGKQVDKQGKLGGTDEVTVKILQEMQICVDCINDKPECSDGINNDDDELIDEKDPGCWLDPQDPGTYDPNDPDEGNLDCIPNEVDDCVPDKPECSDGINNNDGDEVLDEEDPGCWIDPGDPGTYDPGDDDEQDPVCVPNEVEDCLPDDEPKVKLCDIENGVYNLLEGLTPQEAEDHLLNNDPDKDDFIVDGVIKKDEDCRAKPDDGDQPVFTIDLPVENQVMQKAALYNVSGQCEPNYHVFISANNTKDPAYTQCTDSGTYEVKSLKWLDSVQPGSLQTINGYQIDLNDEKAGTDQVNVLIADNEDKPECSDGINNNDGDEVLDQEDPGCWLDPHDPGTYDPGDDDEQDPVCVPNEVDDCVADKPECSDDINNDNDNKVDEKDPGCHTDGNPDNPGTYDPGDDDEDDEPNDKPECSDDINNDNDNKVDEKDPGCHTDSDPDNPGSYDPNDPDEGDEPACSDGDDNDNDGQVDEKDPGCHSDGNPDNPGSYDPGDNDEQDPACSDGQDNDHDGKIDEKDPGCHSDGNPDNPGSYKPGDNDEGNPECSDGINNDQDELTDAADPGCWTNPGDPNSYDPNDDNEINDQCLDYNELRKLAFDDIKNLNEEGARATIALKNTRLIVDGKVSQYILSGYGGDLDETGHTMVKPEQPLNRLEGAKIFLISHCLPILDEDTLPNIRVNGEPMISYHDLPRSGSAQSTLAQDIAYTVQRFTGSEDSIMRGTDQGYFEPWRPFQIQEFMKPLTMVQEYRTGIESGKDYKAVSSVSKLWSYEFYARAAYQGLLKYIPNALSKPDQPILRKYAFDALLHAMLQRNLYTNEDEVVVKSVLKE